MTVDQAASTELACRRVIREMCRKGRIPATKVGSQWRIPRDRFLEESGAL